MSEIAVADVAWSGVVPAPIVIVFVVALRLIPNVSEKPSDMPNIKSLPDRPFKLNHIDPVAIVESANPAELLWLRYWLVPLKRVPSAPPVGSRLLNEYGLIIMLDTC